MKRPILTAVIFLMVSHGLAQADGKLEKASAHFEQNATDGDAEAVFKATGGDTGLAALKVVAPDGRTLIDFNSPDAKLGLRSFLIETSEPKNDGSVQADFPAGKYRFAGRTVSGEQLHGEAVLSHRLPPTATIVQPPAEAEGVPVNGLEVKWNPVPGVAGYIVVVEQEGGDLEVKARLADSATSFAVPDGFLLPDTDYKVAVATLARNGNTSFVEREFKTAEKK